MTLKDRFLGHTTHLWAVDWKLLTGNMARDEIFIIFDSFWISDWWAWNCPLARLWLWAIHQHFAGLQASYVQMQTWEKKWGISTVRYIILHSSLYVYFTVRKRNNLTTRVTLLDELPSMKTIVFSNKRQWCYATWWLLPSWWLLHTWHRKMILITSDLTNNIYYPTLL